MVTKSPPTILTGGTITDVATEDWIESMKWLKNNTPEGSVVAAWWDYGYWITTLGERKTLADNAAFPKPIIPKLATMFLSSEEEGINIVKELNADYVLVFVAAEKHFKNNESFYVFITGGEISKIESMITISKKDRNLFLEEDGITPTKYFWNRSSQT